MRESRYDPNLPYSYVMYGRMSSKQQNSRSPDQQFETIRATITRLAYPWLPLKEYRDDGISGRYVQKRPGFQAMLHDVETGQIVVDLIVVDTFERLGRADEIAEIRRKLAVNHGVLVVAADNNFADPTGVVGKAVGFIESIRATEDTRIKRHNVLRGKRDKALRGEWPGGPVPLGYRLRPVLSQMGSASQLHHVFEVVPSEAQSLRMLFQQAHETGHGITRLARWWNSDPEIPNQLKPICARKIGYLLANPIYVGTLVWAANTTSVVDDTRVIEPNDEAEVIRVPGSCDPIIDQELFDSVNALRQARSQRSEEARRRNAPDEAAKLIAPHRRGLPLKYLLTGLARCGCCGASMRPLPSGRRSSPGRQYTYYVCPRHLDGSCINKHYVPERQLREAVVSRIRSRLFPVPEDGRVPGWLDELMTQVRSELRRLDQQEPDRAAALAQEITDLDHQLDGWLRTLSHPDLPEAVRTDVAKLYEATKLRRQELKQTLACNQHRERNVERVLDPGTVIDALRRLDEVLAGSNPTLTNIELGRHIDRIDCHSDGRVELRGTYLGVFSGAVELLSQCQNNVTDTSNPPPENPPLTPRRRSRRPPPTLSAESQRAQGNLEHVALDPHRLDDLPESLVWTESFVLGGRSCWARDHAEEVLHAKQVEKLTLAKLAKRFSKSIPTIRNALKIAEANKESSGPTESDNQASA